MSASKIRPLAEVVEGHIERALRATKWNVSEAARLLEIDRRSIQRRLYKGRPRRKGRRS